MLSNKTSCYKIKLEKALLVLCSALFIGSSMLCSCFYIDLLSIHILNHSFLDARVLKCFLVIKEGIIFLSISICIFTLDNE